MFIYLLEAIQLEMGIQEVVTTKVALSATRLRGGFIAVIRTQIHLIKITLSAVRLRGEFIVDQQINLLRCISY